MRNYKTEDLTGKRFGMLTVLRRADEDYITPSTGRHVSRWVCKCDCGNIRTVTVNLLRNGHVWNCGCSNQNTFKDLTGQRFGKLTVLSRAEDYMGTRGKEVQWKCKCDCGNICIVRGHSLRNGHTKSCGCAVKDAATKHGMHGTRIYMVYRDMINRCYNKNTSAYPRYGGRGIYICDEWMGENGFINFYNWSIANGYIENSGLTIDRINNNGPYAPDNCRWTTMKVQANNRSNTIYIEYNGITHTISEWSDITGIPYATLHSRYVVKGWTAKETLCTPVNDYITRLTDSSGETHTISEWSQITGLDHDLIYDRIFRLGWSVDNALHTDIIGATRYLTYDGVTMNCSDWEKARGFSKGIVSHRILKGMSIEDALNTPYKDSNGNDININAIYFIDDNNKPVNQFDFTSLIE